MWLTIDFLICMWLTNKEQLLFPLVMVPCKLASCLLLSHMNEHIAIDKFHFLQVLDESVIVTKCNGMAAEIVSFHAGDNFLSGNLNNDVLATFPCDLENHSGIFDMNELMFGQLPGHSETGPSGHAPLLSALRLSCGYIKAAGQKHPYQLLPIKSKS